MGGQYGGASGCIVTAVTEKRCKLRICGEETVYIPKSVLHADQVERAAPSTPETPARCKMEPSPASVADLEG